MNEFMIRFASAEDALSQMQEVESAIRSNGEEITKIRNGFRAEYGAKTRILQDLRGQIDKMSDLGDSMKTFEKSLGSILGLYNAVEQDLLGRLEEQTKTAATGTKSPSPAEEATPVDITADRINEAGKADEKGGLVPGATIIGSATLGAAASDGGGTDPGQSPAAADIPDLKSRLEQMPVLVYKELPENATWEEYLGLLDPDVAAALPESALDYLHELYDVLREFPMPFGAIYFPGIENVCEAGIWTPFYTLISWYYYHRDLFPAKEGGFGDSGDAGNENGDAESGSDDPGNENGDAESESGDSGDRNGETEKQPAETGNESGDSGKDSGNQAESSNPESSKNAETGIIGSNPNQDKAGKAPGEAGVKGHGKAGEAGAETGAKSTAEQAAGNSTGGSGSGSHGGGSGGHSGGSGGGSSYSGEPAVDVPAADDTTKDYLSSLTGETGPASDGASDWALGTMDDWGQKAGGELAGSGAAGASTAASAAAPAAASAPADGSGTGMFGRTARSVLYAAVINAGLEMVMHGAGAVGSIIGGGEEDPFPDMSEGELL